MQLIHGTMKTISIIHLGPGTVGTALQDMLYAHMPYLKDRYQTDLRYVACLRSRSGICNPSGLSKSVTDAFERNAKPYDLAELLPGFVGTPVLIDTTATLDTLPSIRVVLQAGGLAIMANKKPLSEEYHHFEALIHQHPGRVWYETTVGAGLPIIHALRSMLETGDQIISLKGCFSGTLGYVCSQMESGIPYAQAVSDAKDLGFTEPDPRDDLSGMDVARKALILARMIGQKKEISEISIDPFFDPSQADGSIEDFMASLAEIGPSFDQQMEQAQTDGNTLRYCAQITPAEVSVGVQEVPQQSPLGSLNGPDNIIVMQTERYKQNPLVIQGPGAGPDVTAAGVFGDLLTVIRSQL